MKATPVERAGHGEGGNRVRASSLRDTVSAARPRLITPRRQLITILSAVACLTFCLLFLWVMDLDVPHASARGEHLDLAVLAADEQVVVRQDLGDWRDPKVFQYRIGWHDDPRGIVIARLVDPWKDESAIDVLAMGTLTDRQVEGLQAMLDYFRAVREEPGSDPGCFDLVYYRGGEKIGEEHFVGCRLASDLTELHRLGPRGDGDVAYELGRLARQYDVPPDQINHLLTFELLRDELIQSRREREQRARP